MKRASVLDNQDTDDTFFLWGVEEVFSEGKYLDTLNKFQIPNSLAALDGRLHPDDRVLEINGVDVVYSTQEHAAYVIQVSFQGNGYP